MKATPPEDSQPQSPEVGDAATSKLRGLWAVMQPVEPVPEPAVDSAAKAATPPEVAAAPTRGLWAVMGAGPQAESPPSVDYDEQLEPMELVADPVVTETISITAEPTADDALGAEFQFDTEQTQPPNHRGGLVLGLGLVAIPLAMSAWFGLLWTAVLTAACGFGALILAAMELTAASQTSQVERWKVRLGAAAASIAIVLGPYVFAPLGQSARDAQSGRNTARHLVQIGSALGQFHVQHQAFPPGGTLLRDNEGRSRGGHGWMAPLLPFIGQQPLYQQIDFTHPYDEPVNQAAMSTSVVTFFAAGGNRAPNGGGYAVTHFAGVGGDVRNARGMQLPSGIFRSGSPLTQADISDGLATTLAAGELGGSYPAWGDPENLRVPQMGLNKDPRGFGNAARTGATMLFADGHARFFPNSTDPEVLRRLSTRNAGDLTSGVE